MDVAGPLCDQLELNREVSQDPIESLMQHLSANSDVKDLLTSKFFFDEEEAQEQSFNFVTLFLRFPSHR